MAEAPDETRGQPGIAEAALFGLCPRCGGRTLFSGWTRFADRCRACGLDLAAFNVGDGPAAFLTLIVGALVVLLAVWLQLAAGPPWWVHVLLWVPLTTIGVVFGLRLAKAALLQSEFRHRAGEGARAQVTRRVPVLATSIVAVAVATMVALGVWQLRRAEWKEDLIARYQAAQTMSADVPWPRTGAELEQSLFRWSGFTCERVLDVRTTAATRIDGAKGVAQIARCAIAGGGEAEVALGWSTPAETVRWQGGEVAGVIAPNGVLHAAQATPGLARLAPPDPSDLPNNHLMYAGQWFFFALTALAIYVLALRRRWQQGAAAASGKA